jgi:hypothetical protein
MGAWRRLPAGGLKRAVEAWLGASQGGYPNGTVRIGRQSGHDLPWMFPPCAGDFKDFLGQVLLSGMGSHGETPWTQPTAWKPQPRWGSVRVLRPDLLVERGRSGEGGIRTHGEFHPTSDFESGAIDHSTTSPGDSGRGKIAAWGGM